MKKDLEKLNAIGSLVVVLVLFVFLSYLVQSNSAYLEKFIQPGILGILIYSFLHILAMVVAPVTVFPIIVLASSIWGWFWTGVITLISWTIGASIAFLIARKWGVPLVKKLVSLKKLYALEARAERYETFFSILLLRVFIPADILSYALGLFSNVKFRVYFFATILGMAPFVFIYSYLGTINFLYQIIILLLFGIAYLLVLIIKRFKTLRR
ncbi:hypothetical protein CMI41_01760 [Candidatus Pacearchaeota archaeon]|nr:hypothetical protein [Candidatus Pacearchaeota archaeon]|tara:strand:+ start:7738 stop:8370 length:633 start_codon:yes stop_codon:yes gene_type:complete